MSAARDTTRQIVETLRAHLDELGDGLEQVVDQASLILEIEVRKQAGLTDHTLEELAALGHPYRVAGETLQPLVLTARGEIVRGKSIKGGGYAGITKTGKWRAGIRKPARLIREGALGHDIKLVHIQSGSLQGAIFRTVSRTSNAIIGRVGVDTAAAPHAVYVITGTRKMIPRDFMGRGAVIARSPALQAIRTGLNALFRQIKAAA